SHSRAQFSTGVERLAVTYTRRHDLSSRGAALQSKLNRLKASKVLRPGSTPKIFRSPSAQQAPRTVRAGCRPKDSSGHRKIQSEVQWNQAKLPSIPSGSDRLFFRFAVACVHLIVTQRVF